jgi:CRP-like cAMP-binding protein
MANSPPFLLWELAMSVLDCCDVSSAIDWMLDLLFPRDITKVEVHRTDLLQRAHFTQGEIIVRQGDIADCFY